MNIITRFSIVERQDILNNSIKYLWSRFGSIGRQYLIKNRGLSESTIKSFRLGYVPEFVHTQLSGRIIFPIYDASNNLIALSSRLVNDQQKSYLPRYWHEAFHKAFYLYGVNLTKNFIRQEAYAIVVEGQIDACQMYNNNIKNVIASMGTKFSLVHLSVVFRYCDEIVFIYDRDTNQSGQKSMKKIIDQYKKKNKYKITNLVLPEKFDPDEYLKKIGSKSLKSLLDTKINELRGMCGNSA